MFLPKTLNLFVAASLATLLSCTQLLAQSTSPDKQVSYKDLGDSELKLHIFNPEGHAESDNRPAIIFFFGGGWISGDAGHFYPQSKYLASRGIVAIAAEYRTQNSHGTTPKECVMDGKSAIRWVREHATELGIDPNKILAGGGSAGGHVAAAASLLSGYNEPGDNLEYSAKAAALVLFNPVFDNGPAGYGYGRVKDYWENFSPLHNIEKGAPPTLVMLGTKDPLIPVSTAEAYKTRMEAVEARCDLYLYQEQVHGFFNPKNTEHYYKTVVQMDLFLIELGYLSGEPTLKR